MGGVLSGVLCTGEVPWWYRAPREVAVLLPRTSGRTVWRAYRTERRADRRVFSPGPHKELQSYVG